MENKKKGIWIPQELIDNRELDWVDKVLLSEIKSLHLLPKGCHISNNKLAALLSISRTSVIRRIMNLIELGYIQSKNIYKNNKCVGRIIIPLDNVVVAEKRVLVAKRAGNSRNGDQISRNGDHLVVATATGLVAERHPISSVTNSVIKSITNSVINSDTNTANVSLFGVGFTNLELEEELKYRNIK